MYSGEEKVLLVNWATHFITALWASLFSPPYVIINLDPPRVCESVYKHFSRKISINEKYVYK